MFILREHTMELHPFIVLTQDDEKLAVHAVAAEDIQSAVGALAHQFNEQGMGDKLIIGSLSADDVASLQAAIDQTREAIAQLPEDFDQDEQE